jgi:hypothetical protein
MGQFSLTTATNLFKIKYGKISDATYNAANVVWARVNKRNDFTGKRMDVAVPTSFGGGVGSGSLPTANNASYEDAQITAKKVYSVIEVDREAIKAAQDDEGSFVRLTKESVKKGVESCMRNLSRILFNDGTGALGQFSGNAGGTAADPTLTILNTGTYGFKEANWEEKDYVNVNSLSSVFEITAVNPTTRVITLTRISGADDLTAIGAGTHTVYMQNSRNADPSGLKGVLEATGSTLYGVNVGRRWQASAQVAAAGAGITADLMNQVMLDVERKSGQVPNLIVASYTQFRKILNFMEDQKQYPIEPKSSELSFKAVEFMSTKGAVPIVVDRFVEDDRMYFLNDNYITVYNRPGWGWFDDDGTVFLRKASSDAYDARYGGYCELYIPPTFHGYISGLAT